MRKSFALCEAFGLTPFPLSAWEAAADTAVSGGEGEDLKEAGGRRPSASLQAAARGSGVGVEDDHGRSACSRGAAVKLHVEITSRS